MNDEELRRITYEFWHGKPSGVQFNVSVQFSLDEMAAWPAKNIEAFMCGIARVIATRERIDQPSIDQ